MALSSSSAAAVWTACKGWAASVAAAAGELIFPAACGVCGKPLNGPETESHAGKPPWADRLCRPCESELFDPSPRCSQCGLPGRGGADCGGCRRLAARLRLTRPPWQQLAVLGRYDGLLREAVLQAKRPAGEDLAELLGQLLAYRRPEIGSWDVAAVVPIPMHWRRRWLRGTNAAAVLAGQLARQLGVPRRNGLVRTSLTPLQRSLPAESRPANVVTNFRLGDRRIRGRPVLLVDDVATTGATLAAATKLLLEAGVPLVYAAVAARAEAVTEAA